MNCLDCLNTSATSQPAVAVCTECGALLEAALPMLCWRCGLTPERAQVDL